MPHLKYEDIILYTHDLFTDLNTIRQVTAVQICEIKSEEINELCNCGCSQHPLAEIYIFYKTKNDKKSGIRIYPSLGCELVILDCENRGAIIELELYNTIKWWLTKIDSSLIRNIKRTSIIKSELVSKVFSSPISYFNNGHC